MRIECHVPITLRIVGVPTDDQLEAAGRALTRAVAARLAEAERLLADRHGRHGAASVEIREPYDPGREGREGYAVPSFGHGGDDVAIPARQGAPAPAGTQPEAKTPASTPPAAQTPAVDKATPAGPARIADATLPSLPAFNRRQQARVRQVLGKLSTFGLTWNDIGFEDDRSLARFLNGRPVDEALDALTARVDATIERTQVRQQAQERGAPATRAQRVAPGSSVRDEPTLPTRSRLPQETSVQPGQTFGARGGNWDGTPGNSRFHSDLPEVIAITKDRGVLFVGGYPRFDEYARHRAYVPQTGNNDKDFSAANEILARQKGWLKSDGTPNAAEAERYMTRNRLTWHHVEDRITMLAVPFDLHKTEATPHIGGASDARDARGGTPPTGPVPTPAQAPQPPRVPTPPDPAPGPAPAEAGATTPGASRAGGPRAAPSAAGATPATTAGKAAAELTRLARQNDRLALAADALRIGMMSYNVLGNLELVAHSLELALELGANGTLLRDEIDWAHRTAARAKDIDDFYSQWDLRGQIPRAGWPQWDSWSELQEIQFDFLFIERRLNEALDSVTALHKDLDRKVASLEERLEERKGALIFAVTSVVYADLLLFADAAGRINESLAEAARSCVHAASAILFDQRMAQASIKTIEIRIRELGSTGRTLGEMATEDLRSMPLRRFTMRP